MIHCGFCPKEAQLSDHLPRDLLVKQLLKEQSLCPHHLRILTAETSTSRRIASQKLLSENSGVQAENEWLRGQVKRLQQKIEGYERKLRSLLLEMRKNLQFLGELANKCERNQLQKDSAIEMINNTIDELRKLPDSAYLQLQSLKGSGTTTEFQMGSQYELSSLKIELASIKEERTLLVREIKLLKERNELQSRETAARGRESGQCEELLSLIALQAHCLQQNLEHWKPALFNI